MKLKSENKMKLKIAIILILAGVLLSGCLNNQPAEVQPTTTVQSTTPPEIVTLNGAGATFPYPLISKWSSEYNKVSRISRSIIRAWEAVRV